MTESGPVVLRTLADYQGFTFRAFRQACDRSIELDQPVLIARFCPEVLLDTIRRRVRCRQCGRRISAPLGGVTLRLATVAARSQDSATTLGSGRSGSSAVRVRNRVFRRPPQRVDEDPDRAPCRTDVLDFPTGYPIVDGTAAHPDECARLPDRDGWPVGSHRFDRRYATLGHRNLPEDGPAEHPRPDVSASRRGGCSNRARPSVRRVRDQAAVPDG